MQKTFLQEFFNSYLSDKFFVSGGTALAEFYLYHRVSQDIDLFTLNQELDFAAVNAEIIKLAAKLNLNIEHQVSSSTFLQYIFKSINDASVNLKVDLIKDVPIHFGKVKQIGNLKVDSLENIAVGKLLAVFGRADGKDFIDLYFLLKKEQLIKFDDLFKMAQQKDTGLHELYLAEMLAQVENIKQFPPVLKSYDKEDMRNYFLQLSEELLKKIKP